MKLELDQGNINIDNKTYEIKQLSNLVQNLETTKEQYLELIEKYKSMIKSDVIQNRDEKDANFTSQDKTKFIEQHDKIKQMQEIHL